MEKARISPPLTSFRQSADASFLYHEQSGAALAHYDSASQCGNVADLTRNGTSLLRGPKLIPRSRAAKPSPSLVQEHELLFVER